MDDENCTGVLMAGSGNEVVFFRRIYADDIPGHQGPRNIRKKVKQEKECLHPSCNKPTNHNGGYCCAECCKSHRILIKENKNNATK